MAAAALRQSDCSSKWFRRTHYEKLRAEINTHLEKFSGKFRGKTPVPKNRRDRWQAKAAIHRRSPGASRRSNAFAAREVSGLRVLQHRLLHPWRHS
jgi:hypothetical protein